MRFYLTGRCIELPQPTVLVFQSYFFRCTDEACRPRMGRKEEGIKGTGNSTGKIESNTFKSQDENSTNCIKVRALSQSYFDKGQPNLTSN